MKPWRRPLLFSLTTLYRTTIFLGIPLLGFIIYFGRADYLESTLKNAHAYDSFVPAVTQSLASSQGKGGIPFTDPGIRQIVSNGLPPDVLEDSSDKVINGVYDWLEDKSPQPQFQIDLTKNRQYIAENISLYAFNRLTKQPLCLQSPVQIDPFTATCLPANFSLAAEQQSFAQAIEQVFPKTVFTANDLPKFSGNKPLAQAFPHAPRYYHWLRLSPLLLAIIVLGLAASIVRTCRTRRLGYRLLGSLTLSTGLALLVTPLLYLLAYPRINSSLHLQSANTGLNALSTTVIGALSTTFYVFLIKAALIIVNLGLVVVLVERFSRDKDYSLVAAKAGLVNSNKRRQGKSSSMLQASAVPLQSSNGTATPNRATLYQKFRKRADKELS